MSQTICDVVAQLPRINIGDSFSMTPTPPCTQVNPARTHYNGSSANDISAFVSQPFLMGQAYYCALADANGAEALASRFTQVGKFGIESRVYIDKRDPANGVVHGHRIGRLILFGFGAEVESQGISWKLKQETRPAGTVAARRADGTDYIQNVTDQIGYYNFLVAEGANWGITMTGSWRAGAVGMSIDGSLVEKTKYEAYNNNEVTQTPAFQFNYADQKVACDQCQTEPCPPFSTCICSACFSNKFVADHERLCNGSTTCSGTFFSNTTDHVIPYDGQLGGAPGRYIFRDTVANWFHYGLPGVGPSTSLIGEPVYVLPSDANSQTAKNNSTTHFSVTFDASFDIGVGSIDVAIIPTVAFRDGLAIRQERFRLTGRPPEGEPEPNVWTSLDAQSAFQVDARVTVDIPLVPTWSRTFNLLKKTASAQTEPTRIIYDAGGSQGFLQYEIKSQVQDPATAYAACVKQPTIDPPPFTPKSPGDFIGALRHAAIASVHPCNVHICDGSISYDCTWDSRGVRLNCTTTNGPCDQCESTFSLCRDTGEIITQENGQPATANAAKDDVFNCLK